MNSAYVLVTAARNEEAYIEKVIKAVISQTIKPKKWVIVSDGSIDRTEEIVNQYSAEYGFIQLLSLRGDVNRNFASKVYAINQGLKILKGIGYHFIGNIDADIEFESAYFEHLIEKFNNNENLGIAGGWIYELRNGKYRERFGNSKLSVPGSVQMFRRECFEMIDGYIPLEIGGEDATAEVMARMRGWETKSFSDLKVFHHRTTGTEKYSILGARYLHGRKDYFLGYHPLFEVLKCLKMAKGRPFVIGSIFRMFGYLEGLFSSKPVTVPKDIVQYIRKEQMMRVRSLFKIRTFFSP